MLSHVLTHPAHFVKPVNAFEPRALDAPAPPLRLIFWETTKACNLECKHCRAVPQKGLGPYDLTTPEAIELMNAVAEIARPVFILSGGEPLYRPDIFDLAQYGKALGFRMALATNGTLVTEAVARQVEDAGISRVSISLDGALEATHDGFRGVSGAWAGAIRGIRNLRARGISVQINSTVARHNVLELPDLLNLALGLDCDALHIFMLVPVGCGLELAESAMLPADEYERVLHWFYDRSKDVSIDLKATCAPHYFRVRAQRIVDERQHGDRSTPFVAHGTRLKAAPDPAGGRPLSSMTRGCLAGTAVCFVSNQGDVFPCGYLPVSAGTVRKQSFRDIWQSADVFRNLRDPDGLEGKCGVCRYHAICAGCRARAYAQSGNYLSEEPYCNYEPEVGESGGR
jgi:heme b synthase